MRGHALQMQHQAHGLRIRQHQRFNALHYPAFDQRRGKPFSQNSISNI
jgi:hypothetical protein